jgi:serine/threonine-protein kinase
LLDAAGRLPPEEATRYMVQISSALELAHEMGIVHRDIKPANVMVTSDGRAKLADFGLAKRLVAARKGERRQVVAGTPHYMAPELFRGEPASRRSDVYAMGVMLHSLLTGTLPIDSPSISQLIQRHSQPSDIDLSLVESSAGHDARQILERCLAYQADDRYADAAELHEQLRALYGSLRTLESLVHEALAKTRTTIVRQGDCFEINVPLNGGRSQCVYVEAKKGAAIASQVIEIYSLCGPVDENYFRRALELNAKIPHGSIAIQGVQGEPYFVMSDTYPRATCDPEELRQSIVTIAKHADEVEQRLTGGDTH